jgi:NADH dehydrogenase FAD-containing subunit
MRRSIQRVLILGGSNVGLTAAKYLAPFNLKITVVDRQSRHLLSSEISETGHSGGCSAERIEPIQRTLSTHDNVIFSFEEVLNFNLKSGAVELADSTLNYDYLIIALGAGFKYSEEVIARPDDRGAGIPVDLDLTIPGYENVFVVGSLAALSDFNGYPTPDNSLSAIQMGEHAAEKIMKDQREKPREPFVYTEPEVSSQIGYFRRIGQFLEHRAGKRFREY